MEPDEIPRKLANAMLSPRHLGVPQEVTITPRDPKPDGAPELVELEWEYLNVDERATPTNRNCHALTVDDTGSTMYLFGGRSSDRSGCNNHLYYMRKDIDRGWTRLQPDNKLVPKPRKSCGMAWANNKLYLFGGSTQHYCLNDFWIFDLGTRRWQMILDDVGERPYARSKFTMTCVDSKLYIFGGTTGRPSEFLDELYVFDTRRGEWEVIPDEGPCARVDHAACQLGQSLIIQGGKSRAEAHDDYWMLDTTRNRWTRLDVTGAEILKRWGHTMTSFRNRFILMFGGWDAQDCLDDLFVVDSQTWTYVGIDVGEVRPFPRTYHSAGILGETLVICAGRSQTNRLRDTHVLNLSTLAWLDKNDRRPPPTPLGTKFRRADLGINRDSFIMRETLGSGSFGRVNLVEYCPTGQPAEDEENRQMYALKMMRKKHILDMRQVDHVKNEKNILLAIEHPFIVALVACFQDDVFLYLVMEYVPGGEFFRLLRRVRRMNFAQAQFYSSQVVLMMSHLHEFGIVYRDLKPENLLIGRDGYLKLTDFGFATNLNDHENGKCKTICGTIDYIAPEIILGKPYGLSVDWWCVGVFIYEMLAGRSPFGGHTNAETFTNILTGDYDLPLSWDVRAQMMVRQLLRDEDHRLGSGTTLEVMVHPFFNEIDWKRLENKEMKAPYIPWVDGCDDTSNFGPTKPDVTEDVVVDTDEFADF